MPRSKKRPEELELDAIFSASDTSSDEDNNMSSVLIAPNQLSGSSSNKLPGPPGHDVNYPPPAQAPGLDAIPPSQLNKPSTSGYVPHTQNKSNTSDFVPLNSIEANVLDSGPVNQLSNILAKSIISVLGGSPAINNIGLEQSARKSTKRTLEDIPLPTGRPSDANNTSDIQFGVNVNPPPPGVENRNDPLPNAPDLQNQNAHAVPPDPLLDPVINNLANQLNIADPPNVAPNVAVAPDPSLPQADSEIPNWNLDPAVVSWADSCIDKIEWTSENRKAIYAEFTPPKDIEHLFQPVTMPQQIQDAMKDKTVIQHDYLFKRYTTETYLYNCNLDIVTSLRPLMEVISSTKDDPNRARDHFLLGQVFHGLASATVKLSRGRRELARRFVPLTNAPALYRTKPSHRSIFGGDSTQSAVDQAVKDSKQDKSLVFIPNKKQKTMPFRSPGLSGKGVQSYQKFQLSQQNPFPNQFQYLPPFQYNPYVHQYYPRANRARSARQRGRGRGRAKARTSQYYK